MIKVKYNFYEEYKSVIFYFNIDVLTVLTPNNNFQG